MIKRKYLKERVTFYKLKNICEVFTDISKVLLALFFLILIFFLNIKGMIVNLFSSESLLLSSSSCAILLFLFFIILWSSEYLVLKNIFFTNSTIRERIFSEIRFNAVFVVPWLLFSLISDILKIAGISEIRGSGMITDLTSLGVLLVLFIILMPPLITLLWENREFDVPELKRQITGFLSEIKVSFRKVLLWESYSGSMITAAALGIVPCCRYLLITPGLIRLLDTDELKGVVCHEAGHIKRKHVLKYLFLIAGFSLISYALPYNLVLSLADTDLFFPLFSDNIGYIDQSRVSVGIVFVSLILIILFFRFCIGFFMRNYEREADIFSFSVNVPALWLKSALVKLDNYMYSEKEEKSNWHHFTVRERISFIEKCMNNAKEIKRHSVKLFSAQILYSAAVLLTGLLFFSGFSDNFKTERNISILERTAWKQPGDYKIFSAIGDLCYYKKKYMKSMRNYEKSLTLKSDQPDVLNNLAWLYLQNTDKYKEALDLALRAVKLSADSHILDTLAEAYLKNRMYKEAVALSEKALSSAKRNREYYSERLREIRKIYNKKVKDQ